jgi:hypothetical protein
MNAQFFALVLGAALNPKLTALDLLLSRKSTAQAHLGPAAEPRLQVMAVIAVALGAYLAISAPELTARTTA